MILILLKQGVSAVCKRIAYSDQRRRSQFSLLPLGEGAPQGRLRARRRAPLLSPLNRPYWPPSPSREKEESNLLPLGEGAAQRRMRDVADDVSNPPSTGLRPPSPWREKGKRCLNPTANSSKVSWLLSVAAGMMIAAAGCGPGAFLDRATTLFEQVSHGLGVSLLRIGTSWSGPDRDHLAHQFATRTTGRQPIKLIWVELPPNAAADAKTVSGAPFDVLLGGPVSSFQRLTEGGLVEPLDGPDSPAWLVARRRITTRSIRSQDKAASHPHHDAPLYLEDAPLGFDDPRVDAATLAWATAELRKGSWREGYARLVVLFAKSPRRPGWQSGSAAGALERGELSQTLVSTVLPASSDSLDGTGGVSDRATDGAIWDEGVAIVQGARHLEEARDFLHFLISQAGATPGHALDPAELDANDLLADLLGATLVDAQDELAWAWNELDRASVARTSQTFGWLTEPPPWPPASIERMQGRGGEKSLGLVEGLVGQIAPDPQERLWLRESWLKPGRVVDGSLLLELSQAAGGRLVREPRFRAWLRAEWTAWARQRYRRVARLAAGASSTARSDASPKPLP